MDSNQIFILLFVLVAITIFRWNKIYRFIRLPHREPDFKHRHFEYWFDEMIGYSELAGIRFKFEIDKQNFHGKDLLRAIKDSHYYESGALDMEVQIAYRYHIHKKFEEIVLE